MTSLLVQGPANFFTVGPFPTLSDARFFDEVLHNQGIETLGTFDHEDRES